MRFTIAKIFLLIGISWAFPVLATGNCLKLKRPKNDHYLLQGAEVVLKNPLSTQVNHENKSITLNITPTRAQMLRNWGNSHAHGKLKTKPNLEKMT